MEQAPPNTNQSLPRRRKYVWLGFATYIERKRRQEPEPSRVEAAVDIGRSVLTGRNDGTGKDKRRQGARLALFGAAAMARPGITKLRGLRTWLGV